MEERTACSLALGEVDYGPGVQSRHEAEFESIRRCALGTPDGVAKHVPPFTQLRSGGSRFESARNRNFHNQSLYLTSFSCERSPVPRVDGTMPLAGASCRCAANDQLMPGIAIHESVDGTLWIRVPPENRAGVDSDRRAGSPPFAETIRLEQCFWLMQQMWSGLVRPAGGGTDLELLERSWTK